MRLLIWQWGRRGAGPQVAAAMARELSAVPGVEVVLSLSTMAELLALPDPPPNDLPISTYQDRLGFIRRLAATPWLVPELAKRVRAAGVDVALCAMPAPYDFAMSAALHRAEVPYAVVVHDAQLHPGEAFPMQMALQRKLLRRAGLLFALTEHVAAQLRQRGLYRGQGLSLASHPPFVFGPMPPPVRAHGGPLRLLAFGRLLPYKGLDLLAGAMERLGTRGDLELRVVGLGPESADLARLRASPNVVVENRWVPEGEVGALLGWADALVLTHREASQSGVAAAAISARRWVVATEVGGLAEQLADQDMAVLCAPEVESIAVTLGSLPGLVVPVGQESGSWFGVAEAMARELKEMAGIVPGLGASGEWRALQVASSAIR